MKKFLLNIFFIIHLVFYHSCTGDFMISNTTPVTFENNSLFVSFDIFVDNIYKGNVSPNQTIYLYIHNGIHNLKAKTHAITQSTYTETVHLNGAPYVFHFGVL
jgi:hypothetical protein